MRGRIRYFDYGVASIELRMSFRLAWEELVALANQWISSPELESRGKAASRASVEADSWGLQKPHTEWISEDYYVVQVDPVIQDEGLCLPADNLARQYRSQIAQIVRGEESALSFARGARGTAVEHVLLSD